MKRMLISMAAALAAILTPAVASASTGHQGGVVGQRNLHTGAPLGVTTFGCQYDVYRGVLSAQGYHETRWSDGTVTSSTDTVTGRAVSVLVTNNAHTKSYELHGHTVNGLYQHAIYPTYTQRNAKVWISGHRCEGT